MTGEVSPAILKPIRLVLPYPVSVNDFMRSFVPKGQKRPIPFLTPEARAYKAECAWIAKAAGLRTPTERPIELAFTLHPPAVRERFDSAMRKVEVKDGTRMDLDNALKVAIDSLKGTAYVDDRQVHRIRIEYGERVGHGQLVVEIAEFVPAPGPLFAETKVVQCYAEPYLLDSEEKVAWANSRVQWRTWRLGDRCPFRPAGAA